MCLGSPAPAVVLSLLPPTFHTACCVTDFETFRYKASKLQQNAVHSPPIAPLPFHREPGSCNSCIIKNSPKAKFQNKFLNLNSFSFCEKVHKRNGVKYLSFPKGSEDGTILRNTRSRSGIQHSTCFTSDNGPCPTQRPRNEQTLCLVCSLLRHRKEAIWQGYE